MRIDGLWALKSAGRHFAWPHEVSVTIGELINYSRQENPETVTTD
jgi:hypothetical protein